MTGEVVEELPDGACAHRVREALLFGSEAPRKGVVGCHNAARAHVAGPREGSAHEAAVDSEGRVMRAVLGAEGAEVGQEELAAPRLHRRRVAHVHPHLVVDEAARVEGDAGGVRGPHCRELHQTRVPHHAIAQLHARLARRLHPRDAQHACARARARSRSIVSASASQGGLGRRTRLRLRGSVALAPPHRLVRPPRRPLHLVREGFSCCQQRECTVGTWVGATVGRAPPPPGSSLAPRPLSPPRPALPRRPARLSE